ncbi:SRPBCC family protein [Litoreibacter janthinus]|uniref:Polyketide cyclase / dehydrase and lipid transport n=1 Tax=Litoreibacter janthinus TaxID=670154 RepID=A0A1I6H9G2_9RHOB|nr:SRPBCC family protein [Litoreibacter janthinus]SFR50954.1 Polyketide cyclase / dehydrase and lipid transport [Litoreibacter janthinus]
MTHPRLSKSACLVASLVVVTSGTPIFAETSGQGAELACDATMMSGSIAQLNATHATVNTSILIDAPAADVWATLTDFEAMADWSTGTLQGMTGDIRNGGRVVITFLFGVDENGDPVANEIPHTLIYEEGSKIGWSDPFPADIGGGHDNHFYQVQPCDDRTLFIQSDGIVDNPYAANFVTQLLPMYQLFNAELKAAAEK